MVAREAAAALAEIAEVEPPGLVPACRRLIERHVTAGPVWWVSARILSAADPVAAARDAVRELDADRTEHHLADAIPEAATVTVVGWPEITAEALRIRGDVEVLVVDAGGEGAALARRLEGLGSSCELVSESGVGPAAAVSDLVIVEALVAGTPGVLAASGSLAAAAVAHHAGVPVWAVTGAGRVLPEALWEAVVARFDGEGREPWDRSAELVVSSLLSEAVGPDGAGEVADGLAAARCPAAPELLRPAG